MQKLIAWVKPRWKAIGGGVVAGITSAIASGVLSGTWASAGWIAVALLTGSAVHQITNAKPPPSALKEILDTAAPPP